MPLLLKKSIPGYIRQNFTRRSGDAIFLFHSALVRPGVLYPFLAPPVQKRHERSLVEDQEDDHAPLLWEEAERAGSVQPREEEA